MNNIEKNIEKLERLDAHLRVHPTDYQAQISRLKTYSAVIDHERKELQNERLKAVSRIRRIRKERETACRTNTVQAEQART